MHDTLGRPQVIAAAVVQPFGRVGGVELLEVSALLPLLRPKRS